MSNPAVAESVATEVVKLMDRRVQTVDFFLDNARARHGVPLPQHDTDVNLRIVPQEGRQDIPAELRDPVVAEVVDDQAQQQTRQQESGGSSLLSRWAPWVVAALMGTIGGGGLTWALLPRGQSEPPPAPAPVSPSEREGSLYQYLEDREYHLP